MAKLLLRTFNNAILNQPINPITVVEGYNYNQPVNLIVKDDPEAKDIKLRITSIDGIEYFKSQGRYSLYDAQGKPIFNINQGSKSIFGSSDTTIYVGESNTKILCTIKSLGLSKKNINKYLVEYNNGEVLYLYCDKYYCSCGIFQGKEKEGAPMIGKVVELMDANSFIINAETRYTLDIAPLVDNSLILALAIFFINESQLNRNKRYH